MSVSGRTMLLIFNEVFEFTLDSCFGAHSTFFKQPRRADLIRIELQLALFLRLAPVELDPDPRPTRRTLPPRKITKIDLHSGADPVYSLCQCEVLVTASLKLHIPMMIILKDIDELSKYFI